MSARDGDGPGRSVGSTMEFGLAVGTSEEEAYKIRCRRFVPLVPHAEVLVMGRDGDGVGFSVITHGDRMILVIGREDGGLLELTQDVDDLKNRIADIIRAIDEEPSGEVGH